MSGADASRERTYDALGAFFAALAEAGVRHVCICPGSRSTPLAVSAWWASRRGSLSVSTHIDERSAGFFGLGLAKTSASPVALVCTSGSAPANFAPAVVEASSARVPLLVLSADRPPELWDWQAPQTIDQQRLYGSHAKWFAEVPLLGELAEGAVRYAEALATRAVESATTAPAGPVHLNFPFREPLAPLRGQGERASAAQGPRVLRATTRSSAEDIEALAARIRFHERGVVIVGPGPASEALVGSLSRFSSVTGWPVFADVASSMRGHEGLAQIAHYDFLLRSPGFASRQRPEAILQVGATPVSKSLRLWLEAHEPSCYLRIDAGGGFEPSRLATDTLRAEPIPLLEDLSGALPGRSSGPGAWRSAFEHADREVGRLLEHALLEERAFLQPHAALELVASLPDDALLVSANSMPIRHLDAWVASRVGRRVLCNRGANGIDGTLSSALGAAAAGVGPVALLCGDLAFLHDVGGLLAAHRLGLRVVCVVLNDDGGGIFSHLPIAEQADEVGFGELFRTPHGLSLASAAELYGAAYECCTSAESLRIALKGAWARPRTTVLEVPIDAASDLAFQRRVVRRVAGGVGS